MGKLGDSLGKIRVFRLGTVLFTVGSLLAGFNHSFYLLLFARVMQALGASMTMANNNGIITEVFPQNERGKALGLIGSFVAVGSIAGPGIGGLILGALALGLYFLDQYSDRHHHHDRWALCLTQRLANQSSADRLGRLWQLCASHRAVFLSGVVRARSRFWQALDHRVVYLCSGVALRFICRHRTPATIACHWYRSSCLPIMNLRCRC
jgi:MFS family permease